MTLKDRLLERGADLAQNPALSRLVQDERFMKLMVLALSFPGRVASFTSEQKERFAREMGLATHEEVRELQRQVGALQDEVRRLQKGD
jgi:uncharacterized protein YlxW (UPF0749 family)